MDNVSTTSDTTSLASAANFLLSLSGGPNAGNADAQLFAQFLTQNQNDIQNQNEASVQTAPQPPVQTQTQSQTPSQAQAQTPAPVVSSQISVSAPAATPAVTPTLKNLAAAWHTVVKKLQNLQKPKMVATTDASSETTAKTKNPTSDAAATSGSTTASTSTAVTNKAQPASLITGSAATGAATTTASTTSLIANTTVDASNAAATDSTGSALNLQDPKTIADLLTELQILAQMIVKQLQAAGQGNATAGSDAASATAASGSTTNASSGNATAGTAGAASGAQGSATDTGLLSALNAFTASLQGLMGGAGTATVTDATGTDATAAGATAASTDTATSTTTSDAAPTSTAQSLSNVLVLAQLIAKQLDAAQTGTASAAATAGSTTNTTSAQTIVPAFVPATAPLTSKLQNLMDALKPEATPQVPSKTSTNDTASPAASATANAAPLASTGTTAPLAANVFKNSDVQQNGVLNSFNVAAPTNANAPTTGFIPVSAGLTDSGVNKDGAFDLGKDSQGNNAFAASTQNAANNTTGLSSTLESGLSAGSPYSFASQLAATKATGTGVAGLPPAVEQVMLQLNRSAKSGDDQMTLQLNPTDLGRVSIKLNITSDGKVQGTVVANNPATLDMLQKDSRSLERALQDAGLRADSGSLQFSLGGQSGNSSGQLANGSSQSSGSSTTQNLATDSVAATADQTETYYVTPGRVNLRV